MADEELRSDMKEDTNLDMTYTPTSVDFTKKKKRKKRVVLDLTEDERVDPLVEKTESSLDVVGENNQGEGIAKQNYPCEGSEKAYEYGELLRRVYNTLRVNNPELDGDRHKMVISTPQVLREGTKKTVFVNFIDICNGMHREHEHVMNFVLSELATINGSLDGRQRLVIKGRFTPKDFEIIIKSYINSYVRCDGCKGSDTHFSKENGILLLRCDKCGSWRSVPPIERGFHGRVKSRKAGA